MKKIAVYQQILAGRPIRGPHVFFPLFNRHYQHSIIAQHRLYYFLKTDDLSLLKSQYPEGELDAPNVILIPERHHRFKVFHETLHLLLLLIKYRISILHIVSYSSSYDPIWTLKILQWLSPFWPMRKTFALTYNGVPTAFNLNYSGHHKEDIKYENLFKRIRFQGIFTWFEDVKDWAADSGVFKQPPIVRTPVSRFCDIQKFYPAPNKQKIMVWAGAFVVYKRPLMFLEALAWIHNNNPKLLLEWKVIFIGTGLQENDIRKFIKEHDLESLVEIRPSEKNYYHLINTTMLHVSTQSIDHFPNLVINEAMAAGCAIIATNVGRAHLFVKDRQNGYLTPSDDEPGLRHSLIEFLSLTDQERQRMLDYSRKLTETVHTPDNFIRSIDAFWQEVLEKPLL
jgi:glycosyltransferase involved in cell wall biosynthesis